MTQNPRPPVYVNWPRLRLLIIGFIAVLYAALHFVARETLGTPNLAWSAFIGLLAGLGIGIPVLIKQRRIAQDGTDQHLGDAAVRSSASWIGLGVGLGLALISSLYPDSVWFQLDPPPEPIVRLVETPLALGGTLGEGVVGESAQGVRYRYDCARPDCVWEMVGPASLAPAAGNESCRKPVAAPQLLPFAPRPVLSSYAGVVCREGDSASFVVMAAQDGSIWLWRFGVGALAGDGVQPLLFILWAFNGLLAGLFAGLFLFGLKGSRWLPVDRWTSLTRATAPLRIPSLRALWRHPLTRLMRLASIVFGAPGIVLLLVLVRNPGFPNGAAEVLKSILIAVFFWRNGCDPGAGSPKDRCGSWVRSRECIGRSRLHLRACGVVGWRTRRRCGERDPIRRMEQAGTVSRAFRQIDVRSRLRQRARWCLRRDSRGRSVRPDLQRRCVRLGSTGCHTVLQKHSNSMWCEQLLLQCFPPASVSASARSGCS